MTSNPLNDAILAAHAADDLAALVTLYREAGDQSEAAGEIDACCFFLTQAYVFALDTGDPGSDDLRARLVAHGRDE